MKLKNLFPLIAIFLFIALTNKSLAQQEEFALPAKAELVVDNAHVFSKEQLTALKTKLNQLSNETSTQILVYTTLDLNGYDVADFGQQLGEKWGVGGKFDNGIVIVVNPIKGQHGKVTIQTGYGIEPLIPDATANQIVTNEMLPAFKQGDIYGGIDKAVNTCMSLTKGEFTAEAYKAKNSGPSAGAIIILIIFIITFFSMFGRSRSSKYNSMGSRSNLPLWAALFMMGSGSGRGSGYSDFSSGSGGFGGFGGGSFGGGGASGSW